MKTKKKLLIAITMLMLTFLMGAMPVSAKTKYAVSQKEVFLYMKDTYTLYIYQKSKPSKTFNKKAKWKSSDPSVVSVSKKGKLKAKKAGKATITATFKKKKYKVTVNVYDPGDTLVNYFDVSDINYYKKAKAPWTDKKNKKIRAALKSAYHYKDGLMVEMAISNLSTKKKYTFKKINLQMWDKNNNLFVNQIITYKKRQTLGASTADIYYLNIPWDDLKETLSDKDLFETDYSVTTLK